MKGTTVNLMPRAGASLDYFRVFDEGCVKSRRNDLIRGFMTQLEFEEQDRLRTEAYFKAVEEKKVPTPFNRGELGGGEKARRYGKKAENLADEILKQEKQNYVDTRANQDLDLINATAKRLKYLVWIVEDGKPVKLKISIEKRSVGDHKGGSNFQDVMYVGDHDTERLEQIFNVKHQLTKLKEFVPYYPNDIKKVYEEVLSLGSLEVM